MEEHLQSLKKQAFVRADEHQVRLDEKRLKDIREVSAEYLAVMERSHGLIECEEDTMTDKPCVKLPEKVEKVIKPAADEPEKAQIAIEGADPLYREIRIENTLKDEDGQKIRLKQDDEVDVTVEADKVSARPESEEGPEDHELKERKDS
ncbi:MAG TPA: hypothetical protein VJS37_16695 [Terriglobales bacterium]|nr:hypothetical protein [Terriglobales bacterium]